MSHLLVAILALFIGYHIGWGFAHYTISKECELLGGFYVGKDVYQCVKKEPPND